MICLIKNTS